MMSDTAPPGAPPPLDGYEVFECVGVGGLGAVYRARQLSTGAEVAVKMVRSADDDSAAWRRTERELRALAGLRGHANVVGVLEVVPTENYRALVVEFAPGGSISDLVAESGPLDTSEIVFVGRQVAHALESAHERGIVHRDIKPHNLLIDDFGQIKVCDFGVASLLGEDEFRDRTSGLSVRYASPEDVEDEPDVLGPPSDIYSLGATLLFLRRGAPPTTLERVAGWVPPEIVDPADSPDGEIGAVLDGLIADCLHLDPLERPTARAVHERLHDIEARLGHPVAALGPPDDDDGDAADDVDHVDDVDDIDDVGDDDGRDRPRAAAQQVDQDETFDPPDPQSNAVPDSTHDREMHAEFRAALRAAPSVVSPAPDDEPAAASTYGPASDEEFWGGRGGHMLRRPSDGASAMWPRLVVGTLVAAALVIVGWMIVGPERGEKPEAAQRPNVGSRPVEASSVAAPPVPASVVSSATVVSPASVEVVARPDGLDDLATAVWPQAERGACLVQRSARDELVPISCDRPHDLESLGYEEIVGAVNGLDDDDIRSAAADLCAERATGLAEFEGSHRLTVDATVPSAAAWADGDRVIQCWIRITGRRLVGAAVS